MNIIEEPVRIIESVSVRAGTHQANITLHPNAGAVRAGTPLRCTEYGWEPTTEVGRGTLFAGEGRYGGERCIAWRDVVLKANTRRYDSHHRYRIDDIGDDGYVKFVADTEGDWIAVSETEILPIR